MDIIPTIGSGNYTLSVDGTVTDCAAIDFIWTDAELAAYRLIGFSDDGYGGVGIFDNVTMIH